VTFWAAPRNCNFIDILYLFITGYGLRIVHSTKVTL